MRHADRKSNPRFTENLSPDGAAPAVPTFVATDLLEKLIADRDARAVDRVVTARRRA